MDRSNSVNAPSTIYFQVFAWISHFRHWAINLRAQKEGAKTRAKLVLQLQDPDISMPNFSKQCCNPFSFIPDSVLQPRNQGFIMLNFQK